MFLPINSPGLWFLRGQEWHRGRVCWVGFLCKLCDFYDQKYLAVYFPSKTLFGSVFSYKIWVYFLHIMWFFYKKYLTIYFPYNWCDEGVCFSINSPLRHASRALLRLLTKNLHIPRGSKAMLAGGSYKFLGVNAASQYTLDIVSGSQYIQFYV